MWFIPKCSSLSVRNSIWLIGNVYPDEIDNDSENV